MYLQYYRVRLEFGFSLGLVACNYASFIVIIVTMKHICYPFIPPNLLSECNFLVWFCLFHLCVSIFFCVWIYSFISKNEMQVIDKYRYIKMLC